MSAAKQARSVPAHCTPRFSNICVENKGKAAATAERSIMLAATVEAALILPICQLTPLREGDAEGSLDLQGQIRVNEIIEAG